MMADVVLKPAPIALSLRKLIGGKANAINYNDANQVYKYLCIYMDANLPVVLSFKGINLCSAVFLNIAIGQLYGKYSKDLLFANISLHNMDHTIRETLRRVIRNAKATLQPGEKKE